MLPTTFEEELRDCVSEQEVKRIPGSKKKSSRFTMLSFVFSELKSANKEDVANTYGVMKIAFTYTILFHE